jgi:hypothetical protein
VGCGCLVFWGASLRFCARACADLNLYASTSPPFVGLLVSMFHFWFPVPVQVRTPARLIHKHTVKHTPRQFDRGGPWVYPGDGDQKRLETDSRKAEEGGGGGEGSEPAMHMAEFRIMSGHDYVRGDEVFISVNHGPPNHTP